MSVIVRRHYNFISIMFLLMYRSGDMEHTHSLIYSKLETHNSKNTLKSQQAATLTIFLQPNLNKKIYLTPYHVINIIY